MTTAAPVALAKHHGLGNDFLVALGTAGDLVGIGAGEARRWCDRRRGIGADGLLLGVLGEPGWDLVMRLHNADGSVAEMSGNGIRCLAHAELRRRGAPEELTLRVLTGGGPRTVDVRPSPSARATEVEASVDMGEARPGPAPTGDEPLPGSVAPAASGCGAALGLRIKEEATVDVGNPHLVRWVEGDLDALDWVERSAADSARFPGGVNVHWMQPTAGDPGALDLRVWERGVGPTAACGTGAVAAAWAARRWGVVGERVVVHMPGGDVEVALGDRLTLSGPSVFVADVVVPR